MKKLITLIVAFTIAFGVIVPAFGVRGNRNLNLQSLNRNVNDRFEEIEGRLDQRPVQNNAQQAGYVSSLAGWVRDHKRVTAALLITAVVAAQFLVRSIPSQEACDILMGTTRFADWGRTALTENCQRMIKSCWEIFGMRWCNIR